MSGTGVVTTERTHTQHDNAPSVAEGQTAFHALKACDVYESLATQHGDSSLDRRLHCVPGRHAAVWLRDLARRVD